MNARAKRARRWPGVPLAVAAALAVLVGARDGAAVPAVLDGDPVDAGGNPLVVLPGLPFVHWGPDAKWGTADDVFSNAITGDVDIVVRTGGAYVSGSGVIPAPAAGLASAPAVSVGGLQFPLAGTELVYQFILSDGAPVPAAGHPLTATDLDGRGTLVLAYADLDGDGFVGPTNADDLGSTDDALERQEALFLAGRRLALLQGSVASGGLGVTLGLPASAGGLGLVIAGGAITGSTPPLYKDGPWISTLLPCMWPIDPNAIIGGENAGPPDPVGLVDLEIAPERMFCPAPAHPVLGTPYAIPLDGTSITNDLARAFSGAATTVAFARTVEATGFAADPARRILPAIAPGGARKLVEPTFAVEIPDDGPGNAAAVVVFPADMLGNQADPPAPGTSRIELQASANLRIVSPNSDGDPARETIPLGAAEIATVVVDDAGTAGDGGASGRIAASLDGTPVAFLRVSFGAPSGPAALANASGRLVRGDLATTSRLSLHFAADGAPTALDLATHDLTVVVRDAGGVVFYARTFPAGLVAPGAAGKALRHHDPAGTALGRAQLVVRPPDAGATHRRVNLRVKGIDLQGVDDSAITVSATFGAAAYERSLACAQVPGANASTCGP